MLSNHEVSKLVNAGVITGGSEEMPLVVGDRGISLYFANVQVVHDGTDAMPDGTLKILPGLKYRWRAVHSVRLPMNLAGTVMPVAGIGASGIIISVDQCEPGQETWPQGYLFSLNDRPFIFDVSQPFAEIQLQLIVGVTRTTEEQAGDLAVAGQLSMLFSPPPWIAAIQAQNHPHPTP